MSADAIALIDAACEAGERGDAAEAIARLVDAWRLVPDRYGLAEAIEAIGPPRGEGPGDPGGRGGRGRQGRVARGRRSRDDAALRGQLLATVHEGNVGTRMRALAAHRDPRTASAIAEELLVANQVTLRALDRWTPLTDALLACGDPRVAARAGGIVACWAQPGYRHADKLISARDKRLRKLTDRMAARFPAEVLAQLDALAGERARLAELVAQLTAPEPTAARDAATEQALLAAVYANPADDAPRAVYADWLLERGDRLGELIALELQPDHDRSRVYALHRVYGDRIVGRLAPYIEGWNTERGFVATCVVRPGEVPPADPAWATIRQVQNWIPATDAIPMPVLRAAHRLGPDAIVHLASLAAPPPLEELSVWMANDVGREAFARLRLPTLRRLEIEGSYGWADIGPDELPWPWQHLPLVELAVPTGVRHVAAWCRRFTASTLEQLALFTGDWRIVLTRDAFEAVGGGSVEDVVALADGIAAAPGLARIRLLGAARVWKLPARRAIAQALARHPGAAVDIRNYEPPRR